MKARTKYKQSVINIYNSGKVMFQGKCGSAKPNNYFQIIPLLPRIHHLLTNLQVKHLAYNHYNCIGSDEAGSGDYFGPLTVCVAYVSKENVKILKHLWMIQKIK